MKNLLLYATLSTALAMPSALAKTELETLRALCSEQERQIKLLEEENSRLRSAPGDSPVKPALLADPVVKSEPASIPVKPVPAVTAAPIENVVSTPKTHEVKQGETFYSISRIYGITPQALAASNPKVKASALRPGQVLTFTAAGSPKPAPTAPPAPPASPKVVAKALPATPTPAQAAKSPVNPDAKIRAVSVEAKMSYGEFATKNGTSPARLNELNGLDLTEATILAIGSELYVPVQP
jgi:LysM repeat protein